MSDCNKATDLVTRTASTPTIPLAARCKICRLWCDEGSLHIDVHFGPRGKYGDTGNPLVALNRRAWICGDCADTIARFEP